MVTGLEACHVNHTLYSMTIGIMNLIRQRSQASCELIKQLTKCIGCWGGGGGGGPREPWSPGPPSSPGYGTPFLPPPIPKTIVNYYNPNLASSARSLAIIQSQNAKMAMIRCEYVGATHWFAFPQQLAIQA